MKLKTLKDIKRITECQVCGARNIFNHISNEDIKQEAIKWVKQHRNIKPNWAKETNEEFFKAFFNITEEDLK